MDVVLLVKLKILRIGKFYTSSSKMYPRAELNFKVVYFGNKGQGGWKEGCILGWGGKTTSVIYY